MKISLFTPCCHYCNKRLHSTDHIFCLECQGNLPYTHYDYSDNNPITRKLSGILKVNSAGALFTYHHNQMIQNMLYQVKYKGNKKLIYQLGLQIGNKFKKEIKDSSDIIVPVPLHKKKRQKRGYNQATEFANGIADSTDLKVENNAIKKIENNPSQTNLTREQRYENVKNVYKCIDNQELMNKRVLLVDDVITTGSTLQSIGNLLYDMDVKHINIITLATAFEF